LLLFILLQQSSPWGAITRIREQ